jgi:hypothetical protein
VDRPTFAGAVWFKLCGQNLFEASEPIAAGSKSAWLPADFAPLCRARPSVPQLHHQKKFKKASNLKGVVALQAARFASNLDDNSKPVQMSQFALYCLYERGCSLTALAATSGDTDRGPDRRHHPHCQVSGTQQRQTRPDPAPFGRHNLAPQSEQDLYPSWPAGLSVTRSGQSQPFRLYQALLQSHPQEFDLGLSQLYRLRTPSGGNLKSLSSRPENRQQANLSEPERQHAPSSGDRGENLKARHAE